MPEGQLPYVDMNAPRVKPSTGGGSTPEYAQEDDVRMVNSLLTEAKRGREPYLDRHGMDWYKFYRGMQWLEPLPSYLASEVVNYTYADIRAMLALLTDTSPTIVPVPADSKDPIDVAWGKILGEFVSYKWDKLNWNVQLNYAYLDKLLYRNGFWRVEFDRQLNDGLGDVLVEAVDPFMCFPDPLCSDINDRASRYFIYVEVVPLAELKRQYPEHAEKMIADIGAVSFRDQRRDAQQSDLQGVKAENYETPIVPANMGAGSHDRALGMKIHCWLRDTATEEYQTEQADGGEPEKGYRLKWPKGRYIVVAGNCKVEDRENPYDDGLFPFVRFANSPLPREFWGISEVEIRQPTQRMINRCVSHWMNWMELHDQPMWILDTSSGIDVEELVSEPSLVIEKSQGSEVRREMPAPLPAYVFNVYDRIVAGHNVVGGIHDAIRGRMEPGVSSGFMLNTLQEAAQAPIRLQERYAKESLQQAGQMILSRILQFQTEPVEVAVRDPETGEDEKFQFSVQQGQAGDKMAQFRKIEPQTMHEMIYRTIPVRGVPDIKVTTGVGLPFAKAAQSEKALTYYKAGLIDREAALKMSEIENWEEIEQRQKEKEAMMIQAAQQGQPPQMAAAEANA